MCSTILKTSFVFVCLFCFFFFVFFFFENVDNLINSMNNMLMTESKILKCTRKVS